MSEAMVKESHRWSMHIRGLNAVGFSRKGCRKRGISYSMISITKAI